MLICLNNLIYFRHIANIRLYAYFYGKLRGIPQKIFPHQIIIMEGGEKINQLGVIKIDKFNVSSGHLNGVYEEFARYLGIDAALKIYSEFKGQQINFPVRLFSQEYVISQIVELYDGTNINQLAKRFGYSERWVRQMLKKHINESK